MNRFTNWYRKYYNEITWFIVGWLSLDAVYDFSRGNYVGILINAGLIWLNIHLNKRT